MPVMPRPALSRLAKRIREAGFLAHGFGEKKTPEPFYGSQKLGELVRKQPYIEVEEVLSEKSTSHHLSIRLK